MYGVHSLTTKEKVLSPRWIIIIYSKDKDRLRVRLDCKHMYEVTLAPRNLYVCG